MSESFPSAMQTVHEEPVKTADSSVEKKMLPTPMSAFEPSVNYWRAVLMLECMTQKEKHYPLDLLYSLVDVDRSGLLRVPMTSQKSSWCNGRSRKGPLFKPHPCLKDKRLWTSGGGPKKHDPKKSLPS